MINIGELLSLQWQQERAATQVTLGALIDLLSSMPTGEIVANLHSPGSYRGYYRDLYFERGDGVRPAADLLVDCRSCMGRIFTGYKGGDYVMFESTPIWIATYGCTGERLMSLSAGGDMETAEEDEA